MNIFKVSAVKPIKTPLSHCDPERTNITTPPELSLSIQSLLCLNYPVQILAEIIHSHFTDDSSPPSGNLVLKSLKIASISLKDGKLRGNIERILSDNSDKKEQMYQLFLYWSTCLPNVLAVIAKFEANTTIKVMSSLLTTVLFANQNKRQKQKQKQKQKQLTHMIYKYIEQLLPEQNWGKLQLQLKDEYILQRNPLQKFINSINSFMGSPQSRGDHKKVGKFMEKLVVEILSLRDSQATFRQMLAEQIFGMEKKGEIDTFLSRFDNLHKIYVEQLLQLFNELSHNQAQRQGCLQIVLLWVNASKFKTQLTLKHSLKQWLNTSHHFWRIFDQCYNNSPNTNQNIYHKQDQIRFTLFEMGQELLNQKILSESLVKKHLFNYFEGMNFELEKENEFLEECLKKKNVLGGVCDVFGEMVKAQSHCCSKGGVNLISINILSAPRNWGKLTNVLVDEKVKRAKILQPYLDKLENLTQKLHKKCEKKNQKLELAFHVLSLNYTNHKGQSHTYYMTLEAFLSFLQKIQESPQNQISPTHYRNFYTAYEIKEQPVGQKQKREYAGIVIQALMVRILKKSKTPLTKQELYESLNMPEQMCVGPLQKIISKGLVQKIKRKQNEQSEGDQKLHYVA